MESTCSTRAFSVFPLFLSVFFFLFAAKTWACACGCGIFDLGTSSMFPNTAGTTLFLGYDYMNQNQNWNGSSSAAAAGNSDKEIRTHFFTLGGQHMFNSSWGTELELQGAVRQFTTTNANTGGLSTFNHIALGDTRVRGVYTGMSENMSSGITFGLRLPTGDSAFPGFDPDTEIGSGSTDLLLGAYHLGSITSDMVWNWFAKINLDVPLLTQNGYVPGSELAGAFGAYYDGISLGEKSKVEPMLQLLAMTRSSDHGGNPAADPLDTGYDRLYVAPAAEASFGSFRLFGSVEFPLYQYMNGMQLVAPELFKAVLSYSF